MKILPAVVFLGISFLFSQLSFAQDSSVHSVDTSLHKISVKKPVRHKHAVTDSTAGSISALRDTTVQIPAVSKKPAKRKRVITDSTAGAAASLGDTTVQSHALIKKPVKRKHLFTDSAEYYSSVLPDSTDQDLFLALNPYLRVITIKRSAKHKLRVSDSLTLNESLPYSLLLVPLSESGLAALQESILIRDSLKIIADSLSADSVTRHWAGWKKYQVQSEHSYTLYSKGILKGKSKKELQYNIADFYLYLNGQMVKPPKSAFYFFSAGCLCFKYDDTLLLNSGLGFKVGVGVGIKLIDGRFTSTLHANTHNRDVYKLLKDDTSYVKSVMALPVTQSLKLKSQPSYASNEIIIGEYRATYNKFYQKNDDDEDELRQYTVRIIFRCRVSGGIDSMKSLGGTNSK